MLAQSSYVSQMLHQGLSLEAKTLRLSCVLSRIVLFILLFAGSVGEEDKEQKMADDFDVEAMLEAPFKQVC